MSLKWLADFEGDQDDQGDHRFPQRIFAQNCDFNQGLNLLIRTTAPPPFFPCFIPRKQGIFLQPPNTISGWFSFHCPDRAACRSCTRKSRTIREQTCRQRLGPASQTELGRTTSRGTQRGCAKDAELRRASYRCAIDRREPCWRATRAGQKREASVAASDNIRMPRRPLRDLCGLCVRLQVRRCIRLEMLRSAITPSCRRRGMSAPAARTGSCRAGW